MFSALEMFKLVFSVITGLSGTMINSLVLALYFLQWKHSSNSVVYNQIQITIALTNVLFQAFLSVSGMMKTLEMFFNSGKNIFLLIVTLLFAFFIAGIWNTAWLSVFFYVRLVNFSHPYILRMKAMFLSCVPQLMVGTVMGSVIISLPLLWMIEVSLIQNRTLVTTTPYDVTLDLSYSMVISFFGCLVPIAVTCLCIGQCVTSLLRHVWRMNLSESHLTSSQLQGHIRATRIMIMRFLLDMTFFAFSFIISFNKSQIHVVFEYCGWMLLLTYPTAQCLVLIHGNPKLKSKICRQCASN